MREMPKGLVIKVPTNRTRVLAMRPGKDMTVVAHGTSLSAVIARAKKAGVKDPAIFFVPRQNVRHIY